MKKDYKDILPVGQDVNYISLKSNMCKVNKNYYSGYKTFDIITKLSIVIMIIYIVVKISYLMLAGDTRDVLAIETKQWIIKNLKNIVCNEVICTDEYISENKIISVNSMHERNEVASLDEQIIKAISTKDIKEDILAELKKVEKTLEDIKMSKSEKTQENQKQEEKYKIVNHDKKQQIIKHKLLDFKVSNNELSSNINKIVKLENERKQSYLLNQFYTVDGSTSIDKGIFAPKKLLSISNKIQKNPKVPQILIYHTHASEKYINSSNKESDTVVGVGAYLKNILEDEYDFNVLHVKEKYDVVNNKWNRNAYDTALPKIRKIINKNPSIEVVIDLHRDSGSNPVVCNMGGIKVAKVMCFNGICRSNVGPRREIPNKNLMYNLAFSLDMYMTSLETYKDFTKKIYLKGYRYNMHLAKKYMLVEVGNNKNTVEQAKNAMVPLAKILNKVLTTN